MSEQSIGLLEEPASESTRIPRKPKTRRAILKQNTHLKSELEKAKDDSMIDAKTGLRNDRWLKNRIDNAINQQLTTGQSFLLLFMDFDGFKRYNDRFDHPGGDQVLRLMRAPRTRLGEELARYGGDEFVQVLNDDIKLHQAAEVAARNADSIEIAGERLLPTLEVSEPNAEIINKVTVSSGIIESRRGISSEELLKFGSRAVKEGKKAGKDAIVVVPASGDSYQIDRAGRKMVNG